VPDGFVDQGARGGAVNFLTTPVLYGLGAIAIAAGIFAGVQTVRLSREQAAHSATKAQNAAVLVDLAEKTRVAADKAHALERSIGTSLAAAGEQYEKGKRDAQAAGAGVVADLRAGNLRLQKRWAGCEAASAVPGTPASPGGSDATADSRRQGAGDLVRVADESDAQLAACQAVVRADRKVTP
jgi:hypothetical protein